MSIEIEINDTNGVNVRVTKHGNGKVTRELMIDNIKSRDMSKAQIIAVIQQLASTLRYD